MQYTKPAPPPSLIPGARMPTIHMRHNTDGVLRELVLALSGPRDLPWDLWMTPASRVRTPEPVRSHRARQPHHRLRLQRGDLFLHQLHAAVFRAPVFVTIVGNRFFLTEASGGKPLGISASGNDCAHHALRTLF